MNKGKGLLYKNPKILVNVTVLFYCFYTHLIIEELKIKAHQSIWHSIDIFHHSCSRNCYVTKNTFAPPLWLLKLRECILANGKHVEWFQFLKIFPNSSSPACCALGTLRSRVLDGMASWWRGPPDLHQDLINQEKFIIVLSICLWHQLV